MVSTGEESPDDLHEPAGEPFVFNDGNVDEQASQHFYGALDGDGDLHQQASPSILKMRPVVRTGEESADDLHEPAGELFVFDDGNVDEQASQHLYGAPDVDGELHQQASPSILKLRPVVKTGEQSPDDLQGAAGLDANHAAEVEEVYHRTVTDPDIPMEDLWLALAQNEETSAAAAGVTCGYGERVRVTLEMWPRAEQVFDEIVRFWASKSCHFKGDHKL